MAPSTVNNKRRRALMSVWEWNQPHQCSVGTRRQSAAAVQTLATRLTNRITSAMHNNNNRGGMPILVPILFTSHSLLCNSQNARQMLSGGFMHYVLKTKRNQCEKEENPIRVCPILAEVWLSFGRVFQYWPFLKKSILFNKNVKTNTLNILFVHKASQEPPRSRLLVPGALKTKLLLSFHSFLVSSFCLPALSPIFHSKNYPQDPMLKECIFRPRTNRKEETVMALWFQNYLQNRKQAVVIKGKKSEYKTVPSGVPQGSVLGPLLFLIHINDITKNIESVIKLFADDTSVSLALKDPDRRAAILNSDLEKINSWAKQ